MNVLSQYDLDSRDEIVIRDLQVTEQLYITRRGQRIVGDGESSVIRLKGDGGFWLRDSKDVTLEGFKAVGEGRGNAFASGHSDCRNVVAQHLWFEEVGMGISFNAYEQPASFVGGALRDIHLKNIRGKNPGTGYGVHVGEAYDIDIEGIYADNCERHAFYLASSKRPSGIVARKIRSVNHRKDVADGGYRCAVSISRSNGTTIDDVVVRDGFDGALEVSGVTDSGSGQGDTKNITVRNFTAYGRKNVNAYILAGEQVRVKPDDAFVQHLDGVRFENICLMDEDGKGLSEPFQVINGRNVVIDGLRVASKSHSAIWFADSRFANRDNTTDLTVRDAFVIGAPVAATDSGFVIR